MPLVAVRKQILDGRVIGFSIFLRNATTWFFEEDTLPWIMVSIEDRWIFILRRSLVGFRSICILDEYIFFFFFPKNKKKLLNLVVLEYGAPS